MDTLSASRCLRPQDLATLGLIAGVKPKVLSERLGHSSIAVTMDIYAHLIPGMEEEAALAVEQLLERPGRAELPGNVHGMSTECPRSPRYLTRLEGLVGPT